MIEIEPLGREQIKELSDEDLRRLRIESLQTLMFLKGECGGSENSPNAKKWLGNADALSIMGVELCAEYRRRGFKDSLLNEFHRRIRDFEARYSPNNSRQKSKHQVFSLKELGLEK
jgi:hypothetical protein